MVPEIDQTVFNQNLLLTQAYCELQLQKPFEDNAKVLRSIDVNVNGAKLFDLEKDSSYFPIWVIDPLTSNLDREVTDLFNKQMNFKEQTCRLNKDESSFGGKILFAELEIVLPDGASQGETSGFIDEIDWPPIDTWFYKAYSENGLVLFCWIPEPFIETVDNGIAVNILEPFRWYNDQTVFAERLPPADIVSKPVVAENVTNNVFKRLLNFFRI